MRYRFVLPKIVNSTDPLWIHFPSNTSPADPDMGQALSNTWIAEDDNRYFQLAGDGWVAQTVQTVQSVRPDDNLIDSYPQFAFSFDIRKVFTLEYLIKPTPQPNPAKPGS